jgi:hypothetical protein
MGLRDMCCKRRNQKYGINQHEPSALLQAALTYKSKSAYMETKKEKLLRKGKAR